MHSHKEIESITKGLLKEHGVVEPPVDVYGLIKQQGIRLYFEEMDDDDSGLLLVENGVASIAINKEHHPNRQRFTAAHELGHYMLHSKGQDRLFVDRAYRRNVNSSKGLDSAEIEANSFAGNLLMPRALVKAHANAESISDLDICLLALQFEVSEHAMTLRLAKLGLIDPQWG